MQTAVDPYIQDEAADLLNMLSETAGCRIITGQHTQTVLMEEIDYIRSITGREPNLIGFELLSCSPNINYNDASEACLKEVRENRHTLEKALELAKEGNVILTFTFHWFSPLGGRDKSFYAENTDYDPLRILEEGTDERKAFYRDMDVVASCLRPFADQRIPVLWRPFHEAEGKWFWWGRRGPEVACALYKLMFRYFTEHHHLHNLLWVWNCPLQEGYPGDEYVDVISMDIYLKEFRPTDYAAEYERLREQTTRNKIAALAEVGYMPDIQLLSESRVPWAYYMTWSKEFCIGEQYNTAAALRQMYDSEYAVMND